MDKYNTCHRVNHSNHCNICSNSPIICSEDCCKEPLRKALEILVQPPFSEYIDPDKFTIYTDTTSTTEDDTTLKYITSCNGDLIQYSDDTPFTFASLCNMTAVCFQLINPAVNLPLFNEELSELLCNDKAKFSCKYNDDACSCNLGKSTLLTSSLSSVNVSVAGPLGPIENANLIHVSENLLWISQTTSDTSPLIPVTRIYVICLNKIELLG